MNRATTFLLKKRKIHRWTTHSVTFENISPLTLHTVITALFSKVCYIYLVNGWQGGLIKIISKDNLSNSFSVMPWIRKKKKRTLSVVNCLKVIFQTKLPLLLPLYASPSKKLPNRSFDLIISIFSTLANHTMQICINCFKYESKPLMTSASIHNREVFIYSFFQKRRVVCSFSRSHQNTD